MRKSIQRELRIAFSKRCQPAWVRVMKWVVFLGIAVVTFNTRYFWDWMIGLPLFGVLVHLFYRWRTRGWTRPWGGWDDVEAGRE